MSVGEAFKRALFEKIEDEFDVAAAEEAYAEYLRDGKKSRPFSELGKEEERNQQEVSSNGRKC